MNYLANHCYRTIDQSEFGNLGIRNLNFHLPNFLALNSLDIWEIELGQNSNCVFQDFRIPIRSQVL